MGRRCVLFPVHEVSTFSQKEEEEEEKRLEHRSGSEGNIR
jgi:hypothetical protein